MLGRLVSAPMALAGVGAAALRGAAGAAPAVAAVAVTSAPALLRSPLRPSLPRPRVVDEILGAGGRAVRTAATAPLQATARVLPLPPDGAALRERLSREVSSSARALLDLHPGRMRRRVWAGHGRAHIEVRGLSGRGAKHERLARGVTRRLRHLQGVRWAEVNAVTGQVLVAFDERRVDVGTLLDAVRKVEAAQGTRDEEFSWSRPTHPADATPVAAATVELAADCVGVAAALVGTFTHIPPLPRGARAAVALLELEPPLRKRLKRRIGPIGTDVILALATAAVQGLSQGPGTPAVDALYRLELLAETLSRRAVWERREDEFCCTSSTLPHEAPERPPRPKPRPKGPSEVWADRLGPGALGAAGVVLALTRDPGRAADALLAAVPKAARLGREGFATTAARELARRGVVPLNAAAFRRMDRISAVVLDSDVLCTPRAQVLAVQAAGGQDDAELWRTARSLLQGVDFATALEPRARGGVRLTADSDQQGPEAGAVQLVLRRGRRRLGSVTVGRALAPYADALVDAARGTRARVLLAEDASVAELLPRADDILRAEETLAEHVRRLQIDGHGVLVVSRAADNALAAADIGLAVLGDGACVCWSADLVCGPDLRDAWGVLQCVSVARPVSERAVQLAQAASALGVLLALVGGRRSGQSHATTPVYTAAFLALLHGTMAAMRANRRPAPPPVVHVAWHAMDVHETLTRLAEAQEPSPDGQIRDTGPRAVISRGRAISRQVATVRPLRQLLAPAHAAASLAGAVREELQDPLTPVLAVGAAASAVVGSGIDALLVTAVMSGNALVSGTQRLRAERALRRLLMEQEIPARRLRIPQPSGRPADVTANLESLPVERVPARALRPGDIVVLTAADVVPADARLLSVNDLEIDESTLTGESLPVLKQVDATPAAPVAERRCMVFEGTTVLAGSAYAVVVATGDSTMAGRATRAAGRAAPAAGIQARLGEVTRAALPVTGIGGAAVTGLGVLRGLPLREAVAAGVAIAVAAVPEGLPLVSTVAQASAARRLSRRGVLVRSSPTLEALGRVDTVCFDKTGTLTEGRLSVTRVLGPDGSPSARDDEQSATRQRVLAVAARACPPVSDGDIASVTHATDRAVLEAAARARPAPDDDWHLEAELPFETSRGYACSLGRAGSGPILAVKGAPEVLLPLCHDVDAAQQQLVHRLADEGLRVIAVAERRDGLPPERPDNLAELVNDLNLVGLLGIADTPRAQTREALEQLRNDGLRVVMVTGDHPRTARAIARSVGIPDDVVLTGAELDRMTEQQQVRRAAEATVFARVSPEHKVRIVEALRAGGSIVAMAGDGTNDAAAIRLADVGIGVAASRSTSARSAADLVLVDGDISRIHDALLEGRELWRRVREAVSILVGGNAGEVAFMVLGTALSGRAPIGVRQLLLVNLLTDMGPALAVAVSAQRNGTESEQGPVRAGLGAPLARAVAVRGTATAVGATAAWGVGRLTGSARRASSMGLAALVGTQLGQTLITGWHSPLVVATAIASAVALFAAIELPGVSQFFGCTPIGPLAWAVVLASAAAGTALAVVLPRRLPLRSRGEQ